MQGSRTTYHEVKSVGNSGSVIIYAARLEKDQRFVDDGNELFYWFWKHGVRINGIGTVDELNSQLAASIKYGICLPFAAVADGTRQRPIKCLNKQYSGGGTELGYGNRSKGYGDGYSIPLNLLKQRHKVIKKVFGVETPGGAIAQLDVQTVPDVIGLIDKV